jgi:anti-anti-sigma factor
MQVTTRYVSSVLVLALDGELSSPFAPAFLSTARRLLRPLARPLLAVDLTRVSTVDASGFGALVTLRRDVERRQGSLCLVGPGPEVRLLLEIMQLHLLFDVCVDLEQAVEELSRPETAPAFSSAMHRVERRLLRPAGA